ncbi:unnamed protein product, partial [Durusdinium trenchii]
AGHRLTTSVSRRSRATEKEYLEVLGVPLTPDFTAVGLAYFAQGALALAALAKPFYVKDTLGLSPAEATAFISLTYWPWIMKPLWGFIADSVPIFGSRRQAYLVLAGAVSVVGWLGLAGWWPVQVGKEATLLFMMLGNLGIAFSDVVVDGLVVEKARDNPQLMGGLQSFSWACRGCGAILSAYFSGALLETIGVQNVFALTATLPFFVIIASVLIKESKQEVPNYSWDEAKQTMEQVWEVVSSPAVFPSVLFILIWQATPTAGSAMFYFYTNELHFAPEFLGRSQLVGSLASLAGIVLYNRVFSSVPVKDYLFRVQSTAVLLGFLPLLLVTRTNLALHIPDQAFVLGDDVIQTVAGELAHMPILVLAAQLCPPGIEAAVDVSLELGKLRVIQPGCTHHACLGGERIGFPQLGLADLFVQHQWLAALGLAANAWENTSRHHTSIVRENAHPTGQIGFKQSISFASFQPPLSVAESEGSVRFLLHLKHL